MTRSCCQAYVWRGFAADPNGYVLARLTRHSAAIVPPDGVYQVALISVPAGTAGSTTVNIQFWRKYLAAGAGDMRVRAVSVMAAA